MSAITYVCPECGVTHCLKYKDSLKCSKCLTPEFHKMAEKLGTRIIFK